jgi:uncharacterized alkaline shock family protein YloU
MLDETQNLEPAGGSPLPPSGEGALPAGVPPARDPQVPATPRVTGRNVISEPAVAKVVAVAARAVPGVYALGSGGGRALGALRDVVGAGDLTQGVHVEVGESQVAVDINLVAVYGDPLPQIANRVRAAVYAAVEKLVAMNVIEVNVEINDVHVPGLQEAKGGEKPASRSTVQS